MKKIDIAKNLVEAEREIESYHFSKPLSKDVRKLVKLGFRCVSSGTGHENGKQVSQIVLVKSLEKTGEIYGNIYFRCCLNTNNMIQLFVCFDSGNYYSMHVTRKNFIKKIQKFQRRMNRCLDQLEYLK